MANPLDTRRILIMATNGFEQSELEVPLERLQDAAPRSTSPRSRPATSPDGTKMIGATTSKSIC